MLTLVTLPAFIYIHERRMKDQKSFLLNFETETRDQHEGASIELAKNGETMQIQFLNETSLSDSSNSPRPISKKNKGASLFHFEDGASVC